MNASFTYLGGMAVQVVREDGLKLLFDPYITGGENKEARLEQYYDTDYLFVTHAAFDHFGDTVEICRNSHCIVCGGSEVLRRIRLSYPLPDDRWHLAVYGDEFVLDGQASCRPVPAYHLSTDASEGIQTNWNPHGFVVKIAPGVTYYHTGDTAIYSDMKLWRELYHPQVMCVGISSITPAYPREMTPREAAMAVGFVGAEVVIPTHYPQGSADFDEFVTHLRSFAPDAVVCAEWNRPFIYTPSSIQYQ